MISEDEALRLARHAIRGKVQPQADAPVRVERTRGGYVVEFGHVNPPGVRGPDYDARVTLDAETGEVTQILAGS